MSRVIFTLLSVLLILAENASARSANEGWVFSPVVGINRLGLKVFYDTVYNAPFTGQVRITTDLPEDVEGASAYPTKDFYFENSLTPRAIDVEGGLEIRRKFGTQTDFFIGIATWETSAEASDLIVTFPLQGAPNNRANFQRKGKLSYTQYYLGGQHYFTNRSDKLSPYISLSLREIFDVDYEETDVFSFISGPPQGFKRIFVYKSQATGFLMLQLGLGAEYRFAERFSVSLEGSYAIHLKSGALKGISIDSDFNDGDGFEGDPPLIIREINASKEIGALEEDGSTYKKVALRFNGWHVLTKFNIEF